MKVYHELVLEAMEALDVPRHMADAVGRSAAEVGTCLARLVLYSVAPMLDATSVEELAERMGVSDDTVLRQLDRGSARRWARTIRKQGRKMLRAVQEAARSMSPATQSRYRVTYAIDDFAAGKRSAMWRMVAPLHSGAEKKILSGVSLVTFVAVIGDRKLLIPLAVEFKKPRRPGPGRPPLTKLDIAERMMDDFLSWACKQNFRTPDTGGLIDERFCGSGLHWPSCKCPGFPARQSQLTKNTAHFPWREIPNPMQQTRASTLICQEL